VKYESHKNELKLVALKYRSQLNKTVEKKEREKYLLAYGWVLPKGRSCQGW